MIRRPGVTPVCCQVCCINNPARGIKNPCNNNEGFFIKHAAADFCSCHMDFLSEQERHLRGVTAP